MKHCLRLISLCMLVSCIWPIPIFAQDAEQEPLYFQKFTIEDGLNDNWVRNMAQDQQGFIWIGTQSGLQRFDGYEFTSYWHNPEDSTSLSGDEIISIFVDQKNQVWVVSTDGIDLYDRANDNFKRIRQESIATIETIGIPLITSVFHESRDGTLWIGTPAGLEQFDPESQSFKKIGADSTLGNVLSSQQVTSISESDDGRLWIGTYGGGINILDPESEEITYLRHDPTTTEGLPNDQIYNLFIDKDQELWVNYDRRESFFVSFNDTEPIGTPTGLWKMNLRDGSTRLFRYDPEQAQPMWAIISDFEQLSDGSIWFSSNGGLRGGLRKYRGEDKGFSLYSYDANNPGSLPWDYATGVMEGRFGHLWVATSRGLGKADRQKLKINSFTPIPENQFDLSNNFYGIAELGDNIFWISNDIRNQVVWNRNNNTWSIINVIAHRLPVIYDGNQYTYNLADNAIEQVNIHTLDRKLYEMEDAEIIIIHFIRTSENTLMVGTNQGLYRLNIETGKFEEIDISLPFSSNLKPSISYLTTDPTGSIWLLINDASLSESANANEQGILLGKYDPIEDSFETVDIDDSYRKAMAGKTGLHLLYDSRGELWVSESNQMIRYSTQDRNIRVYDEQDGIQYRVLGALEDNDGRIWISTEYGIFKLNPENNVITEFSQDEGIRPFRMNQFSFLKRDNGELMFGGVGGVSFFNPDDLEESEEPPLIELLAIETDDDQQYLAGAASDQEPFVVNWSSNSVNMEYVSVNYRNPDETTYRYQLEGFHDEWVDAGKRRFAQFSNLQPGSYTFRVKSVDGNGIESVQPAEVKFSVLPPWYRSWWAYSLYSVLFIGGVFSVDRFQRRRLRQKEREKAREKELQQAKQIEEAYKELEKSHKNLKAAQEQLVQQEKLASLGQLTAGIAHEIKNPLNFVNNFSDLSIELIEEAREELKIQNSKFNIPTGELSELLDDIEANLKKIYEHGSRADSIVKSMLEHSRGGSGKMEPTDLNALVKEFVNLSFHGMRAGKDPINVDIQFELNDSIGEVPLIAEDFSRVILNLTNNAFDAMREKVIKNSTLKIENYSPKLTVRTLKRDGSVQIEIEDNGPGIPEEIKDKIMQPFFTTKKGTEGTGLGLSITHDIIKAHGGKIEINNAKPTGTVFKIVLP